MKTTIIYIPGLGDGYDGVRAHALRFWRAPGVSAELYSMKWRDGTKSYDQKLKDLRARIEAMDSKIVLIGESAGGSVVMNMLAEYPDNISRAITIFGKNVRADRVSPSLYVKNPEFKVSMQKADQSVGQISMQLRKRLTIFYSKYDEVIRPIDTIIDGANVRRLVTPGHLFSILLVLFVLWPKIIKEATKE